MGEDREVLARIAHLDQVRQRRLLALTDSLQRADEEIAETMPVLLPYTRFIGANLVLFARRYEELEQWVVEHLGTPAAEPETPSEGMKDQAGGYGASEAGVGTADSGDASSASAGDEVSSQPPDQA